ncbi:MAG: pyridoxal phosphate-dependent aminotransferase, partial [Pontimonas sp.]
MSPLAPGISHRLSRIAPSATLKVDQKAKALKAEGRPVISFAAGEPDFPTPAHVVEAAAAAVRDPKNHRYTPAVGLPELRQAIALKTARDSGWSVDASQVVVTNGGKHAVYQACQAVMGPGDEVIIPSPYWTTYPEAIELTGAKAISIFAGADQDYKVTLEQLEAARTDHTAAMFFVSPSNPTGATYSFDETRAIGLWASEHNIWIIADEIYQNLVYDDLSDPHSHAASITEAAPEAIGNTILVNGVAKTYAMTGWRLGWMVGPEAPIKAAANLQSHLSSNVANVSQIAGLQALTGDQSEALVMRERFNTRRLAIVEGLNAIPGIVCPEPTGAFYVYPDVRGLLGKTFGGVTPTTSLELADLILE